MNTLDVHNLAELLRVSDQTAIIAIGFLVIWSLYWKGRALWISSQHADKLWFIILFIINTAGILDIVYIYILAKPGDPEYEERVQRD